MNLKLKTAVVGLLQITKTTEFYCKVSTLYPIPTMKLDNNSKLGSKCGFVLGIEIVEMYSNVRVIIAFQI